MRVTGTVIIGAVLFGLLLSRTAQGQVPPHHWSHRYGASGADRGEAVATDPSGNTIVFGTFRGTADFGGDPLVSAGDSDLFVAKFSPGGDHLWSVRFGSSDDEWARGLAVDDDGGIYLTGSFITAVDFGGGPLVPAGQDDIYLVKLDASGAHVWSRRFGDTDRDLGADLAVDVGGYHVYLTGAFRSTVDFGGGPLASAGGTDMYLAKFKTTTGSHVWSYPFGGAGHEGGQSVAVDGNDDVVLTGYFEGTVDLGGGPLVSSGGRDMCLVKLDSSGGHLWSLAGGGGDKDTPNGVAVDISNNVIVAGSFRAAADFGGGPLASQGEEDIFVAKYNVSGTHVWSQSFGGPTPDAAGDVVVNSQKEIHVTGSCGESVDFGGGALGNEGEADIFLAKFGSNGTHVWSQSFGSFAKDTGTALAVDGSDNVFMTGAYEYLVNFGGGYHISQAGSVDAFVASLDGSGSYLWSHHFGGLGYDTAEALAYDEDGNVFVTGAYCGSVSFGGGVFISAGERDIFLAKYDEQGNHLWSRSFGDVSFDTGMGIETDDNGNVYVTGFFEGTVDFGGGPLTSSGGHDVFLAKYDASGAHLWSRRFGDSFNQEGSAVDVGADGMLALTGHAAGTIDFGGGPLGGSGSLDIFIAVFDPSGAHQWSEAFGSTHTDLSRWVARDAAGNTVIGGEYAAAIDFGGGPLVHHGDYDGFVASFDPSGAHIWSRGFGDIRDDRVTSVAVNVSGQVVITGDFERTIDLGGGPLASAGSVDVLLAVYSASGAHVWSRSFGDGYMDEGTSVDVDEEGDILLGGNFTGFIDFGGGPLEAEVGSDLFLAKLDGAGNHVWSHRIGGYSTETISEAVFAGPETILLTGDFKRSIDLGGGPLTSAGGADIYVARLGQDPSAIDDEPGRFVPRWTAGPARPNPFGATTSIRLERASAGFTSVRIYDVGGRLVRTAFDGELSPGWHDIAWDGRDGAGRRVAPGIYAVRITSGKSAVTRKVVRVE